MAGTKVAPKSVSTKAPPATPRAGASTPRPTATKSTKPVGYSTRDSFETSKNKSGPNLTGGSESKGGSKITKDKSGRTVLTLGKGDDSARVSKGPKGGLTITEGNGSKTQLSKAQAKDLVIKGGAGNDRISVDANVKSKVTLDGGAGDDYLQGGGGNDVLKGGAGRDVVYGLGGNDKLSGGSGRDYLDGSRGNDTLKGDSGKDQVIGGRGKDSLSGGTGNDVLAGGAGKDRINGNAGSDSVFSQSDDRVTRGAGDGVTLVDMSQNLGTSVRVQGDATFQARVESDLDAYRSLPQGRGLLGALDRSGHTTIIRPSSSGTNRITWDTPSNAFLRPDRTRGPGSGTSIYYQTDRTSLQGNTAWATRPPSVGLFHELAHSYNSTKGTLPRGRTMQPNQPTLTDNFELAATGLPYDHDDNPGTPNIIANQPNENAFRAELGLDRRDLY